ncbi:helix-turn-helix domain-containing protein [Microbacterium sp. BH-3-3-3]|uniref:helix-turn-helix domain-containing protein n=1 Tax=Microbacterium sp. BH-3-3-3 TaxID=1906742 RepID=UPI0011A933D3|nr:AraC family transcriptional regulator [Microbacterium sp. BH-3-3-3]
MTSRPALEGALSSIEVRPGRAWRRSLMMGERVTLTRGEAAIVYVRSGELTGRSAVRSGCSVNAPSGTAATVEGDRTLLTGDAFISLGCHPLDLASQSGADVTVVPLEVVPTAHTRALPPVVFVSGFARAEPAAAGLAAHLGIPAPGAAADRQGDETICKLMVTTVLLAALRAWAATEADSSWPPRASDPFLARVVAAIEADPGQDWTIDQLAARGAMSRSVFAARFRDVFGTSPASYVTAVRMRRAEELLDAGTPVSETSRALGYASDEGFRRAFRRHAGVAPSAWRSARRSVTA